MSFTKGDLVAPYHDQPTDPFGQGGLTIYADRQYKVIDVGDLRTMALRHGGEAVRETVELFDEVFGRHIGVGRQVVVIEVQNKFDRVKQVVDVGKLRRVGRGNRAGSRCISALGWLVDHPQVALPLLTVLGIVLGLAWMVMTS